MNKGLGSSDASIKVYVELAPVGYQQQIDIQPLVTGQLKELLTLNSNHWRKLTNIYAKLAFAIKPVDCQSWQQYRDQWLFDKTQPFSLIWQDATLNLSANTTHVIAGKKWAYHLIENNKLEDIVWLDHEFAWNKQQRIIVCPFFDYRQLSNIKIERLLTLIEALG